MFLFRNANLKGFIVDILCEGGRIFKIEENIENYYNVPEYDLEKEW